MATQEEIDDLFRNVRINYQTQTINKIPIDDLYQVYNDTVTLLNLMNDNNFPSTPPRYASSVEIYRTNLQRAMEQYLGIVQKEIERRDEIGEKMKEDPDTKPKSIGGRKSNKRRHNRRRRTNKKRKYSNKRIYSNKRKYSI